MSRLTAVIPPEKIAKLQIYINAGRKTPAEIKAETGADYIINGGLYEGWKPVCHLKVDGNVLSEDQYTYWGYAWDTADIDMTVIPNAGKQNYICCCALIEPSGPVAKPVYTAAQGGTRGRTAIGLMGDKLCLFCSGDGTEDAATPEALRDELTALGWGTAVMLDSGGSSQCDFNGQKIESDREVHNLILVYLKRSACPYPEPAKAIRRGSAGQAVRWLQWHLNQNGFDCGAVDGRFGNKTLFALLLFQRRAGLTADGICGPATRAAIRRK